MDNFLDRFFRIGFFVAAMVAVYAVFSLGSSGQREAAVTMGALAAVFSAFAFLAKFKRFKGLGFEAELWEREMEQAAELRRQLTELADQLGESVVWQMTPRRRLNEGHPFQERSAIIERTAEILAGIGVSKQKIEEIKRPWHKFIMWELVRPIVTKFSAIKSRRVGTMRAALVAERERSAAEDTANVEQNAKEVAFEVEMRSIEEFRDQDYAAWRDDYENVPDLIRRVIERAPGLTAEDRQAIFQDRAEAFLDIDQYARERTVRRPELVDQSRAWRP